MAEGKTEWPQDLKDFANRVFDSCTDLTRPRVAEELRKVIFDAFQAGTIHSTDWSQVTLPSQALGGPGTKGKKRMLSSSGGGGTGSSSSGASTPLSRLELEQQDKKEKRARRFEAEQRKFQQDHDASWSDGAAGIYSSPGSRSLAGRMGGNVGAGPSSSSAAAAAAFSSPWQTHPQTHPGKRKKNAQTNGHHIAAPAPAWTYDTTPSGFRASPYIDESIADPNVIDWDKDTVVGLSTRLEKPYLRLTSAPDPKTVRPLPILRQTLELLKKKWRHESNYTYICDQFKSMRQDLTVQRIKNDFTVKVYEIHARIALEKGDLGEYNQCQSQLRVLYYTYNLPGCHMEFLAYRILYLLHTRNQREISALMSELTASTKADPAVKHALQVRTALATANYAVFFNAFLHAPNMNAYIMDHFVERERIVALHLLAKSFRPALQREWMVKQLGFADVHELEEFLREHKIDCYVGAGDHDDRKWDCKAALAQISTAVEKYRKVDIKGQL